jgi:putative spermidine/putrescine transport system ATP-binding protein
LDPGKAGLELRGIRKTFGSVAALESFDLSLAQGEFVSLLGPSGCGKTTALRVVAGFERADQGSVLVAGQNISDLAVSKRDMGMVFQSYSLFPHLSALDNVAFGLRMRKQNATQRRKVAGDMLELVGLSAHADKYAHQMSGGQQQRVALARALAISPRVLLLDEPLSALDAKVRAGLRDEIRRIQRELGITTLFVTHDQEEAMAISDRVGVMSNGRLEQIGAPADVYRSPSSAFVARFVGTVNTLEGTVTSGGVLTAAGFVAVPVHGLSNGAEVKVLVRPEAVLVEPIGTSGTGDGLIAAVTSLSFRGAVTRIGLDVRGGVVAVADIAGTAAERFIAGGDVSVRFDPSGVFVEPA